MSQRETGTPIAVLTLKLGVSEQAFYRWKRNFAGLGVAKLHGIRHHVKLRLKTHYKLFDQELGSRIIDRCKRLAWLTEKTLTRCHEWRTCDVAQCLFRDGVDHSVHIVVLRMSAVAAYPFAVDFMPI